MDETRLDLLDRRFREQTAAVDNLAGDIQDFQHLLDKVLDKQREDMKEIRKMFSLIMSSNAAITERLDDLESRSKENTDSLEDLRTDISELKVAHSPSSEAQGAAAAQPNNSSQLPTLSATPHYPRYAVYTVPLQTSMPWYLPEQNEGLPGDNTGSPSSSPGESKEEVIAEDNTGALPSLLGEEGKEEALAEDNRDDQWLEELVSHLESIVTNRRSRPANYAPPHLDISQRTENMLRADRFVRWYFPRHGCGAPRFNSTKVIISGEGTLLEEAQWEVEMLLGGRTVWKDTASNARRCESTARDDLAQALVAADTQAWKEFYAQDDKGGWC
ncbi:hypothetical protein IAT38_006932 [Cryptococcus sp. DSM 104549]